jgi:3',5'-cyclic AMP phosphodiesterase CpdA
MAAGADVTTPSCRSFLFPAKGEEVPSERAHHPFREDVEGADEDAVVDRALPSAVQARLHREALRDDPYLAKAAEKPLELANAELEQDGRVLVLQPHIHQPRQRIQPGNAVVDLEDGLAAWLENAAAFGDQALGVCGVLNDAVRIDEVERVVAERQVFAVGDPEIADSARSTPVTIAPPRAKRARSTPAPQPTSRTRRPRYPSKSTRRSR